MSGTPEPDAFELVCAAADTRLALPAGTTRREVERRELADVQARAARRMAEMILKSPALAECADNGLALFLRAAASLAIRDHDAARAIGAGMVRATD